MEEAHEITMKMIQELHDHISRLAIQLECSRLLQQIEADLLEMRSNAVKARNIKQGDVGYMPPQKIHGDGLFEIAVDEDEARHSTIRHLTGIDNELDKLTRFLPAYGGNINDLAIELELFRTSVREEARKSYQGSLYSIAFSGYLLNRSKNRMVRWLTADESGRKRIIDSRFQDEE